MTIAIEDHDAAAADDDDADADDDDDDDDDEYEYEYEYELFAARCRSSHFPQRLLEPLEGPQCRGCFGMLRFCGAMLVSGLKRTTGPLGPKPTYRGHGFNSCSPHIGRFQRTCCKFAPLNSSILALHVSLDLTLPVQCVFLGGKLGKNRD